MGVPVATKITQHGYQRSRLRSKNSTRAHFPISVAFVARRSPTLAERKLHAFKRQIESMSRHPRSNEVPFGFRQACLEQRTRSWRAAGRTEVLVRRGARHRHDTLCLATVTSHWQRQRRLEARGWFDSAAKVGHDCKSCAIWRYNSLIGEAHCVCGRL